VKETWLPRRAGSGGGGAREGAEGVAAEGVAVEVDDAVGQGEAGAHSRELVVGVHRP